MRQTHTTITAPSKGSGQEFAELICAPSNPGAQMTMHHMLGQSVFDVQSDEAWGETLTSSCML